MLVLKSVNLPLFHCSGMNILVAVSQFNGYRIQAKRFRVTLRRVVEVLQPGGLCPKQGFVLRLTLQLRYMRVLLRQVDKRIVRPQSFRDAPTDVVKMQLQHIVPRSLI